jgi:pyruvate formate lyase activating enzyme
MIKEAMLYEKLDNKFVHCCLCAHQCKISPSKFGICGVRQNRDGVLYTLVYGEAIASHIDPIEKKPLYHFFPGSGAFSIATIGCNFKCGFCQNWQISQISKRDGSISGGYELMPEKVVKQAKRNNCLSISYTYTEPTIFFEYAYDTAKLAKEAGLYNNFVTNGYMSKEALDTIRPYLDAANVDLKSFNEDYYKKNCRAHLSPVLDSIAHMKKLNIWVEVTTLIVPGENDSEEELNAIAKFIANLGKDIPWHISRFHPNYQFTDYPPTSIDTLKKAKQIGNSHGLRYIYLGNVLEGSDTYCPNCNELLVSRTYFYVEKFNIKEGRCPSCATEIDGIWSEKINKNGK